VADFYLQAKTGSQTFVSECVLSGTNTLGEHRNLRAVSDSDWLRWRIQNLDGRAHLVFEANTEDSRLTGGAVKVIEPADLVPSVEPKPPPGASASCGALGRFLHRGRGLVKKIMGAEEDDLPGQPLPVLESKPVHPVDFEPITVHVDTPPAQTNATLVVDFGNTQSAAVAVLDPDGPSAASPPKFGLVKFPNTISPTLSPGATELDTDTFVPSCVLFESAVGFGTIFDIGLRIGHEARHLIEVEGSLDRSIPRTSYCYVPKRFLVYGQQGTWTDWNQPQNPVLRGPGAPYQTNAVVGFYLLHLFRHVRNALNGVQRTPHLERVVFQHVYLTFPLAFSDEERVQLKHWAEGSARVGLDHPGVVVDLGVDEATAAETFFLYRELDRLHSRFDLVRDSFVVDGGSTTPIAGPWVPRSEDGIRVLTFDCGGGTTDICAVDVRWDGKDRAIERKILACDTFFTGGDDLTQLLINDLVNVVQRSTGIAREHFYTDLKAPEPEVQRFSRILFTHLKQLAERIKVEFSQADPTENPSFGFNFQDVSRQAGGERLQATGTDGWRLGRDGRLTVSGESRNLSYSYADYRSLFESHLNPLRKNVESMCALAVEAQVDCVLLTGMTCRTPFIRELIVDRTHLPSSMVISVSDVDLSDVMLLEGGGFGTDEATDKLAVALGAAYRCAVHHYDFKPSVKSVSKRGFGVCIG